MKTGRPESVGQPIHDRTPKPASADCTTRPKVHTSFRISPVVELFSRMNGEKEKILIEFGLHGLTHLPREDHTTNRSFDWQFAFCLLRQLDTKTACLDLGVRGKLKITCEDVELVIGVPCLGQQLQKSDPLRIQETKELVKQGLLLGAEEDLNLQNIIRVLERDILEESYADHRRAFVMAAFIMAVSYFLAPKGRPAKVNNEILECMLDTENLKNINWASYVLLSLREASVKLKRELAAKTKSVTLDGCLLLLQVVYLDNMDFGPLSTKHDCIPRIIDFSFDRLHELINADKKAIEGTGATRFGVTEIRDDGDTLYTRGDIYRSILISKQRLGSGVFTASDKEKILEYVRMNVDEGKRRVKIASRQFQKRASNTLDQCHHNISALLDVWLAGRVITIGQRSGAESSIAGIKGKDIRATGVSPNGSGTMGRYKTMSRRPRKVRRMDTLNEESASKQDEEEDSILKDKCGLDKTALNVVQ